MLHLLEQVGLKYGLDLLSPVDDAGKFTDEAGPGFAGKAVQVRVMNVDVCVRILRPYVSMRWTRLAC